MPCPPPPLSKTGAGFRGGRASRRFRRPIWTLLVLLLGAWGVAAEEVATQPVVAAARRAGLRVLEGRHLILITDRPVPPACCRPTARFLPFAMASAIATASG